MKLKYDLTNKKIGRWTILKLSNEFYIRPNSTTKEPKWECLCDCGNIKNIRYRSLIEKTSQSCGCLQKERVQQATRKKPKESNMNRLFISYKNNANKRNIKFLLNKEQFIYLISQNCYYCNIAPFKIWNSLDKDCTDEWQKECLIIYNGIDRINNKNGYTIKNSVPCCYICNSSKSNRELIEFKEWVIKIYNNWASK